MRIVFVTHQYPPRFNTGTELYARRLARKLSGQFGHDVRIYTFEPFGRAEGPLVERSETMDGDIPVTRFTQCSSLSPNVALGAYYNVFHGKAFGQYLEDVQPDVVHFFHTAFHGASVIEETRLRKIPSVVNLMDYWFLCPSIQFLRVRTDRLCDGPEPAACLDCLSVRDADYQRIEKFAGRDDLTVPLEHAAVPGDGLRWNSCGYHAELTALAARPAFLREVLLGADRIVAPSETMRSIFVRHGYDEDSIRVVRYGVDPMPPHVFWRSPSESLRIGFVGSINRPKGPHLLVEAVARLQGDIRLELFGDQTMFPAYAEEVFDMARKDRRVTVRGPLRPERVPEVLRNLDALVVPSLWHENTPFVVLESRAAGVPVVGSDVAGIAEIIDDGVTGRLFRAGDVDSLREVLADLLEDREQVRVMSGRIADVKTLITNTREFERMYQDLIERSDSVPSRQNEEVGG